MNTIVQFVQIFVYVLLLDFLFFWVNDSFLQKTIRGVQGKPMRIRWLGALICYVALASILYATQKLSYRDTFLLGMGIYAIYEGTNYAIFRDWPLSMVLLDTLWGGILFVSVRYLMKKIKL
jgi:uncharacterized membrane protein